MRRKFLVLTVKELLKSVYIYGSYSKIKTGVSLFWTTRYITTWRILWTHLLNSCAELSECCTNKNSECGWFCVFLCSPFSATIVAGNGWAMNSVCSLFCSHVSLFGFHLSFLINLSWVELKYDLILSITDNTYVELLVAENAVGASVWHMS